VVAAGAGGRGGCGDTGDGGDGGNRGGSGSGVGGGTRTAAVCDMRVAIEEADNMLQMGKIDEAQYNEMKVWILS
jgi:hypothetical protein